MSQPKTQLAKQSNGALQEMPEYLRRPNGEPKRGNENVAPDDVIVPRIALCQSTSFERKKSHARYIEGLEEGEFFNTATKENYGKELHVINVHYFKSRIRWQGEIGEGMLCRSQDSISGVGEPGGKCAMCEFQQFNNDKDDTRPGCTLFMNFPCLVIPKSGAIDLAGIAVISMKSIAIGTGKRWNTLVNIRNADRFAGIYKLTSVEDHRESGDSWQPHIENDGWVTSEQARIGAQAYELIHSWRSAGRLKVEEETVAV